MASAEWWHDQARDLDQNHAYHIMRAYKDAFSTGIQPALEKLKADIARKEANGEKAPVSWLLDQDRLRQINYQVSLKLAELKPIVLAEVTDAKNEAVDLSQKATADLLGSFSSVPPGVLEEIIGTSADGHTPLGQLLDGYDADVSRGIRRELVNHAILGRSAEATARALQHQLGKPLTSYMTLVRTETARAYTNASLATYRANPNLVWGWRWLTAEDELVCDDPCGPNADKAFPADEDMDTHPNCRCAVAPVTMDDALNEGLLDEQPDDEFGDMFGEPPPLTPEEVAAVEPEPESPFPRDADEAMDRINRTWEEYQPQIDLLNEVLYGTNPDVDRYFTRAERDRLQERMLEDMRAHLYARDHLTMYAIPGSNKYPGLPSSTPDKHHLNAIQDGINDFSKYISASKYPDMHGQDITVYATSLGRSFQHEGRIFMNGRAGDDVVVHEMGHVLETRNPDVLTASYEYMRAHATSASATTRPGYDAHELFWEGRYFDKYVGKEYVSGGKPYATEVLSMGLQYMHKDPLMLAQNDPDLFRYTWEATR